MTFHGYQETTASSTDTPGTVHTVSWPATIDDKDLLIFNGGWNADNTITLHADWVRLGNSASGAPGTHEVWGRIASGSGDGGRAGSTFTVTSSASQAGAFEIRRYSGHTGGLVAGTDFDIDGNSWAETASPDPPSNTTVWGSPDDTTWIALGAARGDNETASAAPTDFGNLTNSASSNGGGGGASVYSADRQVDTATLDPAAFTLGSSERTHVFTLALKAPESLQLVRASVHPGARTLTGSVAVSGTLLRAGVKVGAGSPVVETAPPPEFPGATLDQKVELWLDGGWVDVSARFLAQQVGPMRGRQDEASETEPSSFALILDNQDGALTPDNANSPWWPDVDQGMQLRLSVRAGTPALVLPGTRSANHCATPDHPDFDVTDLDLRIRVEPDRWSQGVTWSGMSRGISSFQRLVSKWAAATDTREWNFMLFGGGWPAVEWATDGTQAGNRFNPSKQLIAAVRPIWLAFTLDVDDGTGNHVATVYRSDVEVPDSDVTTWDVVDTWNGSGVTSVYQGDTDLLIGAIATASGAFGGRVLEFQMRDAINGTLVANPVFTDQPVDTRSFQDSTGKTWTVFGDAEISNWRTRFVGSVDEIVPFWPYGDNQFRSEPDELVHEIWGRGLPTEDGLVHWWSAEDLTDVADQEIPNRQDPTAPATLGSTSGADANDPTIVLDSPNSIEPDGTADYVDLPYTPDHITATEGELTIVMVGHWASSDTSASSQRLLSFEGANSDGVSVHSAAAAVARPRLQVGGADAVTGTNPAGAADVLADGERYAFVARINAGVIDAWLRGEGWGGTNSITGVGVIDHETFGRMFSRAYSNFGNAESPLSELVIFERALSNTEAEDVAEWLWTHHEGRGSEDPHGEDPTIRPSEARVALMANGILRRLGQGADPLRSPLWRHVTSERFSDWVLAYWPCEDPAGAARIGPGLSTHGAMLAGGMELGAESTLIPSAPLPLVASDEVGTFRGNAIQGNDDHWAVDFVFKMPTPEVNPVFTKLITVHSAGDIAEWHFELNDTNVLITAYDQSGASVINAVAGVTPTFFDGWNLARLEARQSGDDIAWVWSILPIDGGNNFGGGATVTTATLGRVASINTTVTGPDDGYSFGHIVITDGTLSVGWLSGADTAWVGESAAHRFWRLCAEEGIEVEIVGDQSAHIDNRGDLALSQAMGPQEQLTLLELLNQCAAVDLGVIIERRGGLGLVYRTRQTIENQIVRLTLDAAADNKGDITHPLEPRKDDQQTRNDVTVSATFGAVARLLDQASIDARGRYREEYTLATVGGVLVQPNISAAQPGLLDAVNSQNVQQAGWRLHLGTWKGLRYPIVSIPLHIATDQIDDWLGLELGDRFQLINLPQQHPDVVIDMILQAAVENMEPTLWTPELTGSPAGLYQIGELS